MTMFEMKTEWGEIRFSKNVITRIVTQAVESCRGNATIMNYRGKYKGVPGFFSRLTPKNVESGDIVIEETEEGLVLTVYIVIRFGASLNNTVDQIIDRIYDDTEDVLDLRPAQVKVIVTGTASRDIARRHLEFSR